MHTQLPAAPQAPATTIPAIGVWSAAADGTGSRAPLFAPAEVLAAAHRVREPVHVLIDPATGGRGLAFGGTLKPQPNGAPCWPVLASLPALYPEWLGDRSFCEVHGTRFPYAQGAMANGIATTRLVISMAQAGCLGFFGAAGLQASSVVEAALDEISQAALGTGPNAALLGQQPDPQRRTSRISRQAVVDLYLRARRAVACPPAAYMALTPMVVQLRLLRASRQNARRLAFTRRQLHVFAKISRPEVAKPLPLARRPPTCSTPWSPSWPASPPTRRVSRAMLPVAEDVHRRGRQRWSHRQPGPHRRCSRPSSAVRDRIACRTYGYHPPHPPRCSRWPGHADVPSPPRSRSAPPSPSPAPSTRAAVESGLLRGRARECSPIAGLADVVMAPAADMFELGVKVQVLQRGTFFAKRGRKLLYDVYKNYNSMRGRSPPKLKAQASRSQMLLAAAWKTSLGQHTRRSGSSPATPASSTRPRRDPKHHQMALIFRSYLGQASALGHRRPVPERRMDYQIWCGPAMGAFNAWAQGSFLEAPEHRTAPQVALNLLEGAAVVTRAQQLRSYGAPVPTETFDFRPRPLALN